MPRRVILTLDVPSRSRPSALFKWLFNLLEPHGMKVIMLQDMETGTVVQEQDSGGS